MCEYYIFICVSEGEIVDWSCCSFVTTYEHTCLKTNIPELDSPAKIKTVTSENTVQTHKGNKLGAC